MGYEKIATLAERCAKYVQACGKRSILETKPPVNILNINGLKYTPNLAEDFLTLSNKSKICAKQIELTNIKQIVGVPSDRGFIALLNGKPIARYQYSLSEPISCCKIDRYPKSWIDINGNPKQSLFVDYISTEDFVEGSGYGRLLIQRLYYESKLLGCEGRLSLKSSFGSHGFYDKLGFEVGERTIQKKMLLQKQLKEKLNNLLINNKPNGLIAEDQEIITIKQQLDTLNKELSTHVPCEAGSLFFTPTEQNLRKLFKQ